MAQKKQKGKDEKTPYTDELAIEAWHKRYVEGKNVEEIVEEMGISNSSVSRWSRHVEDLPPLKEKARALAKNNTKARLGDLVWARVLSKKEAVLKWLANNPEYAGEDKTVEAGLAALVKREGLVVYPSYLSTMRSTFRAEQEKLKKKKAKKKRSGANGANSGANMAGSGAIDEKGKYNTYVYDEEEVAQLDGEVAQLDGEVAQLDGDVAQFKKAVEKEELEQMNQHLRDEVAYYKWVAEGEGRGWMQRFIDEKGKIR